MLKKNFLEWVRQITSLSPGENVIVSVAMRLVSNTVPFLFQPTGGSLLTSSYTVLQSHERDALLSGPLSDMVRIANEQDRTEWSASNTPKSSDPHIHKKATGRSKHPSGSNVSFSKDTEGGEEESMQVEYAKSCRYLGEPIAAALGY